MLQATLFLLCVMPMSRGALRQMATKDHVCQIVPKLQQDCSTPDQTRLILLLLIAVQFLCHDQALTSMQLM